MTVPYWPKAILTFTAFALLGAMYHRHQRLHGPAHAPLVRSAVRG
ncbi:hypothetical protein [Pseudomonas grimontii]|nr:hypothetical protein [Pseudomonas grimontii]